MNCIRILCQYVQSTINKIQDGEHDPTIIELKKVLGKWEKEKTRSDEDRQGASIKILEAYRRAHETSILDLTNYGLTSLPYKVFPKLTHLTEVKLAANELKDLPQDIHKLKKLRTLDLAENPFEMFPIYLNELPNLTILNIQGNSKIKELPPNITKLTSLNISFTGVGVKKINELINSEMKLLIDDTQKRTLHKNQIALSENVKVVAFKRLKKQQNIWSNNDFAPTFDLSKKDQ